MIMAVSMHALWSGPAKAAQAESGQWTSLEVFVSFFIAGAVVAVVAQLSLMVALTLRRSSFDNNRRLNAFAVWIGLGTLCECMAASAVIMLVVWVVFRDRLLREQLAELELEPAS